MSPHRGLVIENGQSIKDLYMERSPLYSKYSDFVVDTDRFSVSECVNKIANLIQTQG